jgi:hypothetical protein
MAQYLDELHLSKMCCSIEYLLVGECGLYIKCFHFFEL